MGFAVLDWHMDRRRQLLGAIEQELPLAEEAPPLERVFRRLDAIQEMVRRIVRQFHPERVILFGSHARGDAGPDSDVDLLVTFHESAPVSTADLLEMAGEAEELIGRPVDFVLRPSLEKSPNRFASEHILATAVCLYGN